MDEGSKGLMIKLALMLLTAAASYLHVNVPDAQLYAFATDAVGAGVLAWGWWRTYGQKLVPHHAVAVDTIVTPANVDHPTVQITTTNGTVSGKLVGAILIAFALALADPSPSIAASADPLSALKTFALGDIQAALDDANANNDTAAAACWGTLLPVVQSQQALTLKKLGVFLALQKARDTVRNVDMLRAGLGPIGELKNKCAAVIVDTNTFLLRLGIVGAGAVALPF